MDASKRKEPHESNSSRKRPMEVSPQRGGKRAAGGGGGGGGVDTEPARVRPRSAPPPPPPAQDEPVKFDAAAAVREQSSDCYESDGDDEEDDPLLSSVPSHLDPERLGFLVCAQETLRYLYRRGIPHDHPIFTHLRTRFIRGLNQMGLD